MIHALRPAISCLLALALINVCQAAPNTNFADDKARDIVGGRKILITVTQNSIEPGWCRRRNWCSSALSRDDVLRQQ
jgi:hypothetical protein